MPVKRGEGKQSLINFIAECYLSPIPIWQHWDYYEGAKDTWIAVFNRVSDEDAEKVEAWVEVTIKMPMKWLEALRQDILEDYIEHILDMDRPDTLAYFKEYVAPRHVFEAYEE